MTKLPRDLSGKDLVQRLRKLGYSVLRQQGSHIALTTDRVVAQPCFVPNHKAIRPGTLSGILKRIASDHGMSLQDLLKVLGL